MVEGQRIYLQVLGETGWDFFFFFKFCFGFFKFFYCMAKTISSQGMAEIKMKCSGVQTFTNILLGDLGTVYTLCVAYSTSLQSLSHKQLLDFFS